MEPHEEFTIYKGSAHQAAEPAPLKPDFVADVLDELTSSDALCISEGDAYERAEALARNFVALPARARGQLVDVLSANLSTLAASAQQLLSQPVADDDGVPAAAAVDPALLARHRSGLKMAAHLLRVIAVAAQREADAGGANGGAGAGGAAAAGAARGGRKAAAAKPKARRAAKSRSAAAGSDDDDDDDDGCAAAAAANGGGAGWDWVAARPRVLLSAADVLHVDLRALFKGLAAAEGLVNVALELALQGLECAATCRKEAAWEAARDVLARGAVAYGQLDFVAGALFERARRHEHAPPLVAGVARHAEDAYNSTALGVKLLACFAATPPEGYDQQYATNSGSVRLAGELLVAVSELQPRAVANHVATLRPYLGCGKAHVLRGALLSAAGAVLARVFPTDALSASLGEGAAAAHLRSKEHLLVLLRARVLDKVAYVRQRVLQVWARLVEESCVPLSHWNTLLAAAVGRLGDESQLVVKAALQLLHRMLHRGIFQPPLRPQVYLNTLRAAEAQLEAAGGGGPNGGGKRRGVGDRADDADAAGSDDDDEEDEDDEGADKGARWEEGGVNLDGEQQAAAAAAGEGGAATAAATTTSSSNDAAVTRLRTMVASLKEGLSFCRRLQAALPAVAALLANPAAGVVHDAVVFLTLAKTYEVEGAARALRGMWPLAFSKHEAVRASVLDSWHILHLRDRPVRSQLEELLTRVLPGSTLSELAALEAIAAALAQQGKLPAAALMKLAVHEACHHFTRLRELKHHAAAEAPAEAAAAGNGNNSSGEAAADDCAVPPPSPEAAAVSALRACFSLMALLSAAQPSAVEPRFVPVLLEVGFSADVADAWVARHACLTLRHAAPHLAPGRPGAAAVAATAAPPGAMTTMMAQLPPEPLDGDALAAVLAALARLLVAPPCTPAMARNWPSAAEAAVAAIYALAPRPQELMAAVLGEMFARCRPGGDQPQQQQQQQGNDPASAAAGGGVLPGYAAAPLARFFYALGRAALQHLLHVEAAGKAVRQARLAADRAAAEAADRAREAVAAADAADAVAPAAKKRGGRNATAAAAARAAASEDDIGAQLGVGSVSADAALDALVDEVEGELLGGGAQGGLLGRYGALLSGFCHLKAALAAPQALQEAALLALAALMAVDGRFCADNVALLMTLLVQRHVAAPVRVNLVVALADLASRWPNVLEPWTAFLYAPLSDPEPAVRLAALSSLTHLVLGGVVKAKGNVARVAALLVDDDPAIVDRAALFFEELARSGGGGGRAAGSGAGAGATAAAANPVYNLLPDCLSALLCDARLREEQLAVIMGHLLGYARERQADALRERLVARLQAGGPREWRVVAWCVARLGYSERGVRRAIEQAPLYRHALGEPAVFDAFMALADKGRRAAGGGGGGAGAGGAAGADAAAAAGGIVRADGDLRGAIEDWVADLVAARDAALEAAEVEAAAAAKAAARRSLDQGEDAEAPAAPADAAAYADAADAADADADSGAGPVQMELEGAAEEQQQQQQQQQQQVDRAPQDPATIELMCSQDVADHDREGGAEQEQEAAARQAEALAASVARLSLARPGAAASRRAGSSAAAAAVAGGKKAAAAGAAGRRRAGAAAAGGGAGTRVGGSRRRAAASESESEANSDDDDDDDDGDDGGAPSPPDSAAKARPDQRGGGRAATAPKAASLRGGARRVAAAPPACLSSEDDD